MVGCRQNINQDVAGDVDLWTCGLGVVDRISIMYVAGPVDLSTIVDLWVVSCRLWIEYPSCL